MAKAGLELTRLLSIQISMWNRVNRVLDADNSEQNQKPLTDVKRALDYVNSKETKLKREH